MPGRDELQWVEFTDFSPGIHSNNNLAGGVNITSDNPCKAQESGTFRCISLPTGGLGPLPRRVDDFGLTENPFPIEDYGSVLVTGLGTWGRVFPSPPSDVDNGSRYEIHLGLYAEFDNGDDTFDIALYWVRERLFDINRGTEVIQIENQTAVNSNTPYFTWIMKTRMNPTTPTDPGVPVVVFIGGAVGSDLIPLNAAWPNPADSDTNDAIPIPAAESLAMFPIAAVHQSRVVLGRRLGFDHGLDTTLSTNENLLWTNVNDDTVSTATPAVFVPEIDAFITDMCSMSANQLFVIKTLGGGYVLQGDLDDVTVLRLPNLMCSDGASTVRGVNTPKGFIYSAGYNGLYIWNGGDQATQISQQLDGNAFITGQGTANRGHGGQCDRWMNLIVAPRNWIWQSEEDRQGWWRLENPDDLMIRLWSTTSDLARLVGVESSYTADDQEFMHQWNYPDLAYSYEWLSHPLWVSQDQRIMARQGIAAVQGHGIITVTLIDEDGNESPKELAVDSDNIRNVRWDVRMDAENLIVKIESAGTLDEDGNPSVEAPLLHRLFIGCMSKIPLANANQ